MTNSTLSDNTKIEEPDTRTYAKAKRHSVLYARVRTPFLEGLQAYAARQGKSAAEVVRECMAREMRRLLDAEHELEKEDPSSHNLGTP